MQVLYVIATKPSAQYLMGLEKALSDALSPAASIAARMIKQRGYSIFNAPNGSGREKD